MSTRGGFGNACSLAVVPVAALLLWTVGTLDAGAFTPAQVKAKVSAALAGPPEDLEAAILDLLADVPADEAGQVAEYILATAKNAPFTARTAIGRALARYALSPPTPRLTDGSELPSVSAEAAHIRAAKSIVTAMENAAQQGDRAALAVYQQLASASLIIPEGPVGSGLNTQTTSPAE